MDWSAVRQSAPELWQGMQVTLLLCLCSACCALFGGVILAWLNRRAPGLLQPLLKGYTALTLGLPLLVVVYLLYFVLPEYGIELSSPVVGVAALTLYYAPYVAQVIRTALQGIPRGQWEATRTLGLSPWQALRDVILPQALPQMLSPLVGLLIGLIKDSALLSVVSVREFMYQAKQAISQTYAPLEIYLTVALIYWVINTLIDSLARHVEHRMTRYRQRSIP